MKVGEMKMTDNSLTYQSTAFEKSSIKSRKETYIKKDGIDFQLIKFKNSIFMLVTVSQYIILHSYRMLIFAVFSN